MTNTSTMDTKASADQILRIAQKGADYVRLTTQGVREAENMRQINSAIRSTGCNIPLIADVHFNPKVADVAALYTEKVRINPGNYVDSARTFRHIEYTDRTYANELKKIETQLTPFLRLCQENHTAIRIGVNHGSLSDRIMSRYGDTVEGIVESCMEFLRICIRRKFTNVVVSIKASNTTIMVRSVRALVAAMQHEGMSFPLHLGVTEAGEGEDGRIKSSAGIGALLADGIGDTIRVSLSEEPETEIPVARKLVEHVLLRANGPQITTPIPPSFNYLNPERRATTAIHNIGGNNPPIVIVDTTSPDTEPTTDTPLPDYIYSGRTIIPNSPTPLIVDADIWDGQPNTFPAYTPTLLPFIGASTSPLKFLFLTLDNYNEELRACLHQHPEIVLIAQAAHTNTIGAHRALAFKLISDRLKNPIIIFQHYTADNTQKENFQIHSAADCGALLFDGLADGLYLHNNGNLTRTDITTTAFGILQATRTRTTKTEYISCPGCGRTLYNLSGTIQRVRAATKQFKGLKIAIMGCIVNGPGEMADADYGYVGAARGKISLYRGKICVKRNIPEEQAVEQLLDLIKADRNNQTQQ